MNFKIVHTVDGKTCDKCGRHVIGYMEYEDGGVVCSECIHNGALITHICVCGDPECKAGN